MTPIKRCWRPQGRFLREFARTGSVSAACRASWDRALVGAGVPLWHDGRTVGHERAAELKARRKRDAALSHRLDEAAKRIALYEAGLRATAARKRPDTDDEK